MNVVSTHNQYFFVSYSYVLSPSVLPFTCYVHGQHVHYGALIYIHSIGWDINFLCYRESCTYILYLCCSSQIQIGNDTFNIQSTPVYTIQ